VGNWLCSKELHCTDKYLVFCDKHTAINILKFHFIHILKFHFIHNRDAPPRGRITSTSSSPLFMSVIIKQWRLPTPSPLHLCYTMFRTLGHNYIIHKYLFRLYSLMPSSRWYKGLNFNSIYTTGLPHLGVA